MSGGFSMALTIVCIIGSFLAGMMVNESGHHRRRMQRAHREREAAARKRHLVSFLGRW